MVGDISKIKLTGQIAGRYGYKEMLIHFHDDSTIENILYVEGVIGTVISELNPDIYPPEVAREIVKKATLEYVSPERVREREAEKNHDVVAINADATEKETFE